MSFTFTYDGLSDITKLDGLFEAVAPGLRDLSLHLQSAMIGLRNKYHVEDLSLCFFPNLRKLKLDVKLWCGETHLVRLLDSLPQPAELLLVVIEIDGMRDLEAEVWTGVHDKLTAVEEPPMLHIHIYFNSQLQIDEHEGLVCSRFERVLPFYWGSEIFRFELRCPTSVEVFTADRSD